MKDVAKLAGVSTSTVSHVINKTHFVSDPVIMRVQSAIEDGKNELKRYKKNLSKKVYKK
jgi:DNA-binding LacI/PurR family transcriptional regulator